MKLRSNQQRLNRSSVERSHLSVWHGTMLTLHALIDWNDVMELVTLMSIMDLISDCGK